MKMGSMESRYISPY